MNILLIDGNIQDVRHIEQIIKKIAPSNNISILNDGQEAIDFFNQLKKLRKKPPYDFILLDIDLPKVDGLSVLSHIQNDEEFKKIPVIILSAFSKGFYKPADLGVMACFEKHYDYDELKKCVEKILELFHKN